MFINRIDAGLQLSEKLSVYKNTDAVILALPRGGVPIAYTIALELNLMMDIVLTKKIGHPQNKEYGIGCVSLKNVYINNINKNISETYLKAEIEKIKNELKEKYKKYTQHLDSIDYKNKTVIIVDDGMATGNTMLATIDIVKLGEPKKIVIAIPVAPIEAISRLKGMVEELICIETPPNFIGVGQFYENFEQVSDEEVIKILKKQEQKETLKENALE